MKKKPYKRNTVILNLRDDLNLEHDIDVEFWKDPSQGVLFELINMVGTSSKETIKESTAEEMERFNRQYFECASLLIEDCSIEGIDFRTAESTEAAFYDKRVSWGVFHLALIAYLSRLIDEYEILKKVLGRVVALSNSGEENKQKEEE
jgi:hypothetical protein